MDKKLVVSSTPHTRSEDTIDKIMKHVLIALVPATLAGIYFFGLRSLLIVVLTVASSVFFEAVFQKVTKQDITIQDSSAAVTGLLLAMNLPPTVPFWLPIVGSFFAIVIVKQLYGGLGQNFMNPALGARAFLLISFSKDMTTWIPPINSGVDAVTYATPLGLVSNGFIPTSNDYINAFIGNIGGCIGETSAVLLLAGGLYLMFRKVISWRVPVTYIVTVLILSFFLGRDGLYEILIGGLMIGAFFMATDYSSSPVTPVGQLIMGVGCGVLTSLLRVFSTYPEAVSFAILLMNLAVPLIDRYFKPRVFGTTKRRV